MASRAARARGDPGRPSGQDAASASVRRLNWGCGPKPAAGWVNADLVAHPGVDLVGDIRDGLPVDAGTIRYIASIHALQDLPFLDVVPALRELNRVLEPGGVLRLGLPDLERGLAAYQRNDAAYFYVPDSDAATISGKLIVQMTWYGSNRMMFTFEFADELLRRAGFRTVTRCAYRESASRYPEIVELDNRERESLYVEAEK